jgi:hypothetical protein
MEALLRVDLVDLATNIHFSEDGINFAHLFLDFGEYWGAIEGATDTVVPIAALFPQDVLVSVLDEVLVAVALGNEEDELAEEHVVFVDFFEILVGRGVHSRCCS